MLRRLTNLCTVQNLQKRDPDPRSELDKLLLACIRRVILDSFWSRESRTVAGNGGRLRKSVVINRELGLPSHFRNPGPFPLDDHCGYSVALNMVQASWTKGKYGPYTQFDTIRQYSSVFSNHFRTTVGGSGSVLVMGDENSKQKHFTQCPTKSEWFGRFMLGCKRRMGQDVRQNLALGSKVVVALLDLVLEEISEAAAGV